YAGLRLKLPGVQSALTPSGKVASKISNTASTPIDAITVIAHQVGDGLERFPGQESAEGRMQVWARWEAVSSSIRSRPPAMTMRSVSI
ncbi:MAG: hypothetical protein QGM50_11025, partial [Anaerolineae bacterium]|nr:hypothetical protein [Anaerolineae bacterium]